MSGSGSSAGFGIYIHWPFCLSRCPYCDFNAHLRRGEPDAAVWGSAYRAALRRMAGLCGERKVTSIFFGGGTPSLAEPRLIGEVLQETARLWRWDDAIEITLEANPTSVETSRLRDFRAAGVNRLSLGVQALDDGALRLLGRNHDAAAALAALEAGRRVFSSLSFDLIYGRPNQTLAAWERELEAALRLETDHLSLYQLTIEPGTMFDRLSRSGQMVFPEADDTAAFQSLSRAAAAGAGLPPYEVSNFARPGAECRHNLIYWQAGEWIGVGPGAHGRFHRDGVRCSSESPKPPQRWLDAVAAGKGEECRIETLTPTQDADEYLLMAMRTREGVDRRRHAAMGGRLDDRTLDRLQEEGWLAPRDDGRIVASENGFMVLDRLILELSSPPPPSA